MYPCRNPLLSSVAGHPHAEAMAKERIAKAVAVILDALVIRHVQSGHALVPFHDETVAEPRCEFPCGHRFQ